MLGAIGLCWFHYDASEKNNSLNGHSNEPQINEQRFIIPPVTTNLHGIHQKERDPKWIIGVH